MRSIIQFSGEHPLSACERRSLRSLVALMIPSSTRYGVPGADDDAIFADILETLRAQASKVSEMLRSLDAFAGARFADLDPAQCKTIADQFRGNRSAEDVVGEYVIADICPGVRRRAEVEGRGQER